MEIFETDNISRIRPCYKSGWAYCDGSCDKCRVVATSGCAYGVSEGVGQMSDLIKRQAAIDALCKAGCGCGYCGISCEDIAVIEALPAAQPTLYGYNIEHLELIARVLQKENLPPERIVEALTDISRIVATITDEFGETLRKAVANCGAIMGVEADD